MSFGFTDVVRPRTRAAHAGAGWWRAVVVGVAGVAIALLAGLPVAARASEQPLGSPAAPPDDGAAQHPPPEAQSAPEPAASPDQAPDAVELGDEEDAGGHATRGELAAAASAPRLTRDSPGSGEAGDSPAPPEHAEDDARAAAWQARAASGTAAASERRSQVVNDSDDTAEHTAAPGERTDDQDAGAPGERTDDQDAGAPGERTDDQDATASDEEATPATPRVAGTAAVPPALRQRAAALRRRLDRDVRRSTPDRTDVRSSDVDHVGSTTSRTRSFSRFASTQRATLRDASTATLANPVTTAATTAATTARGSVRARSGEPDKHAHADAGAGTRQRTAPMPPPSRRGTETTTTGTVASGPGGGAFGASPVTGGLIVWALATGTLWFMLRERAHRMRSLLWAAPLERPG